MSGRETILAIGHEHGIAREMSESSNMAAVIPVFNRPKEVIEALESVAAQTVPPSFVAVVDDGSTDDTAARVEEWFLRRRWTVPYQLVRQANMGVSTARNCGVKAGTAAGCGYVGFLDSDDLWPVDYVARMDAAMRGRPEAVAAVSDRVTIDFEANTKRFRDESRIERETTRTILVDRPPTPSHTVVRVSAFWEVGGFDAGMYAGEEDYHLALKLSLRGQFVHVPGEPVTKRDHTAVVTGGDRSLVAKNEDHLYCRARMLDRFICDEGGAAVVPGRHWRPRVGRLWVRAGRAMTRLGRDRDARLCFERAVAIRPWDLRARWLRRRLRTNRSTT